jgi:hypothetical protein
VCVFELFAELLSRGRIIGVLREMASCNVKNNSAEVNNYKYIIADCKYCYFEQSTTDD